MIGPAIGNAEQYVTARYRGAEIQPRRACLYLAIHRSMQRDHTGINHRFDARSL
jgi:hypothetical protein